MTAADVVARVGLHPSTVRAHLEQLVDAGLLVRGRASHGAPGRPAWRYRGAVAEPTPGPYRILAAALLDHLATAGNDATVQAGEAWGRRLAAAQPDTASPVETALNVLQQVGFDPRQHDGSGDGEASTAQTDIHLHACPFLDLISGQPDAMCALHAGMIRGVMQATGAQDANVVLEPFAAPTACVVRLHLSQQPQQQAQQPTKDEDS